MGVEGDQVLSMRVAAWWRHPMLVAVMLVSSSAAVLADEDQQQARQLREAGEVLPLQRIIATVRQQQPGRLLEVELEQHQGRWIYEVELLATDGVVWEFEVDAASGELLRRKRED